MCEAQKSHFNSSLLGAAWAVKQNAEGEILREKRRSMQRENEFQSANLVFGRFHFADGLLLWRHNRPSICQDLGHLREPCGRRVVAVCSAERAPHDQRARAAWRIHRNFAWLRCAASEAPPRADAGAAVGMVPPAFFSRLTHGHGRVLLHDGLAVAVEEDEVSAAGALRRVLVFLLPGALVSGLWE